MYELQGQIYKHACKIKMESRASVVVHGGAWAIPDHLVAKSLEGVQKAARKAFEILQQPGNSALDAVQAAVCTLENDPTFDAGNGSVLNAAGQVEMDAIIMEGKCLNSGAVACVKNIRNPINLARLVMEKTDHMLLVGDGANLFAKQVGIPEVDPSELVSKESLLEWERYSAYQVAVDDLFCERTNKGHETVGAVAIDRNGLIACATSTGGITFKMVGRVGDSPLIGCGAYCDNTIGGVSCTGHGESIMKTCLAHRVISAMKQGDPACKAAASGLSYMKTRVGGFGGVIALSCKGELGVKFSTERMPWAFISDERIASGIEPDSTTQIEDSI